MNGVVDGGTGKWQLTEKMSLRIGQMSKKCSVYFLKSQTSFIIFYFLKFLVLDYTVLHLKDSIMKLYRES